MGRSYHVAQNGEKSGPFDEEIIKNKIAEGSLRDSDLCWTEGMETWLPISQVFGDEPPPIPSGTTGAPLSGPTGSPPPMPETYLVSAILATIFCCLPLGIVSIVYASQVTAKYQAGDYAGAEEASNKAKFWYHMSLLAVVIFVAIAFVVEYFGDPAW